LLHATCDMPLGAVVAFSSVAGRFGNAGQIDYSAANDLLCKSVSHLRSARPETRAIAIDWTAWAGIGMASRGSIPKMMEAHRIDGTPVLPGVMGIEGFAEVAKLALPGWHVVGIEDVRFLAPLKFYRSEPRPLMFQAVLTPDGEDVVAACRLIGTRTLPGQAE